MGVWAYGGVDAAVRLFAALLVVAALGGCASTHTVSRSDAEALAGLTENLGGKTVEVVRAASTERGTRLRVFADSTRWLAGETTRSVPTDSVRSFVVDPRASNVKLWAGVGAAFFGLITALSCDDADLTVDFCTFFVLATAIAGAFTFGFYAAIGSERVEYRLVE
jgi:hypothetical protein